MMKPNSLYFTIQEELGFDQWYHVGYNLPDKRYEAWLKINHPEHLSFSQVMTTILNLAIMCTCDRDDEIATKQLGNEYQMIL